jgi:hypothetical protein
MTLLCLATGPVTTAAGPTAGRSRTASLRRALAGGYRIGLAQLARQHITTVNPHLDADNAIGGAGHGGAKINIGA